MNKLILITVSIILLGLGSLFFLHQESWIIVSLPCTTLTQAKSTTKIKSEEITVWFWKKGSFHKETTEIIVSDDIAQTLKLLINNWFNLLEEEGITDKQITVQSVALAPSGQEAFISLNQQPFDKQASTHAKLMLMESLLKTINQAKLGITSVRLLIHHQSLQDDQLNFDISWPIQGYLT